MTVDCAHGSDPSTCPVCAGPTPKPRRRMSSPFTARFPGSCRGCDLPVYEGELVVSISGGSDRWTEHAGCAL